MQVKSPSSIAPTSTDHPTCVLSFGDNLVELPMSQTLGSVPAHVTMTKLGQHAGQVFEQIEHGIPALVTKRGAFIAAIVPLDSGAVDDLIVSARRERGRERFEFLADRDDDELFTLEEAARRLGIDLTELDD